MRDDVKRFGETDLYYRVPDPTEAEIDDLDGGPSDCGIEESRYFHDRRWTGVVDKRVCRCIQLLTGTGAIVGYVAFDVVTKEHPTRRSAERADYLFVYHLCLDRLFQGKRDESISPPVKWAIEAMRLLEDLAVERGCVGLYLNVRIDNEPARKRYADLHYVEDGEYNSQHTGHRMVRMRRVLPVS